MGYGSFRANVFRVLNACVYYLLFKDNLFKVKNYPIVKVEVKTSHNFLALFTHVHTARALLQCIMGDRIASLQSPTTKQNYRSIS